MLYLDGINNTRNGHSYTTTAWEDLSGNNNDYTLNNVEILDNSVKFLGNSDSYASLNKNIEHIFGVELFDERTIELVVKSYTNTGVIFSGGGQSAKVIGFYNTGMITTSSETNRFVFALGNVKQISSYNIAYTKDSVLLKKSNINLNFSPSNHWYSGNTQVSYIGKRDTNSMSYNGEVMSIRVYNRVLSDDEVENNFKIDKNRYGIN